MNRTLPWITLVVGLALGTILGLQLDTDGNQALQDSRTEAGEDLVKRSEFDAELDKLRGDEQTARQSAEAAFGREKAANEEISRLKDDLAAMQARLSAKEEVVAQSEGDREARLARIEKRFLSLKGKGLQNLLATNAIGKLIADLRQEGDVGREAVLALLASDVAEDRQLATTLLMQGMADSETILPLKDTAMHDEDELTKRLASQALMRIEGDEVIGSLEDLVANADDEGVRVNSMYGLMMRGKGVEQAVAYYENEENSSMMRQAIGQSAFLLSDRPEVQPLIDAIVRDARGKSRQDATIEAAVNYYKSVKSPAAIEALQRLAADPNIGAAAKQKAADALREIGG